MKLVGLVVIVAGAAATDEPVNPIEIFGFDAFEVTAMLPVKLPADPGVKITLNDTDCPGPSVTGGVIPDVLNPVPVVVTAEMLALVPPVFFRVSVCIEFWPTVMFVNVKLDGVAVIVAGVATVPLNGIENDGFVPSEVTTTFPLNVPEVVGANFTVKVVVSPAVSVTAENPDTLNPVPLAVALATSTLVPPVFFSVTVCVEFWPTCTPVNVRLLGDALSVPAATPVPDSETSIGVSDPWTVIASTPVVAPSFVGPKKTVTFWL